MRRGSGGSIGELIVVLFAMLVVAVARMAIELAKVLAWLLASIVKMAVQKYRCYRAGVVVK